MGKKMSIKDLFKKTRYATVASRAAASKEVKGAQRQTECPSCHCICQASSLKSAFFVCARCGHHLRINARARIAFTCDKDSFIETHTGLATQNPLNFTGYPERIAKLREKTGNNEAVVTGKAAIGGSNCYIAVMDSEFLMASMGSVVGEKLARTFEDAAAESLPVVVFAASGGARMHEGILSLMQMAKVSGAVGMHAASGNLYVTVLTDPTTGGVTASFAMLGDIVIAEPGALIGFAGQRVIEGTIGEKLPEDFQRAEFLLKHGFLDMVVHRAEMKSALARILSLHGRGHENA